MSINIDNQKEYWDEVAENKTFTHPIDLDLLSKIIAKGDKIIDFGCGYGRMVDLLIEAGYNNIQGFDSSKELIKRGRTAKSLPVFHIEGPENLPLADESVDCFLLFAVLTCIPSNNGQSDLIDVLYSKLKKGGLIYISDYYLQDNLNEVKRYNYLNNDKDNYGVFSLPEGATFRHHEKKWIKELTKSFNIKHHKTIEVKTLNGNSAEAFQLIGQK